MSHCRRARERQYTTHRAKSSPLGATGNAPAARRLQWVPGFGIGALAAFAAYPRFGCGCSSGVEHNLAKVGVVGSNPIARSKKPKMSTGYPLVSDGVGYCARCGSGAEATSLKCPSAVRCFPSEKGAGRIAVNCKVGARCPGRRFPTAPWLRSNGLRASKRMGVHTEPLSESPTCTESRRRP